MGKAVINVCYGGFGISEKAYNWLKEHNIEGSCHIDNELLEKHEFDSGNIRCYYYGPRHHPLFIKCIEELGEEASGMWAELKVETFEGNLYRINDYDGYESIETPNDIYWNNVND